MSRILKRSQFLRQNRYNTPISINEAAISNDIPWGDSLVGRLIDSILRKAKIAYNSKRISTQIKNLRKAFDDLIETGKADMSGEDKKILKIWVLFSEIKNLVENGGDLKEIKRLTILLRDEVADSNLDDKENLIRIIQEFIDFLNQFDDIEETEEGGDEDDEEDDEEDGKDDDDENVVDSESKTGVKVYPLIIKNLKALSLILSQYNKGVGMGSPEVSTGVKIQELYYTTKQNDTIEKIQTLDDNKFKWSSDKIWSSNIKSKNQLTSKTLQDLEATHSKDPKGFGGSKYKRPMKAGVKIFLGKYKLEKGKTVEVSESLIWEEATIGVGGSPERGKIKSGEDHLKQSWSKLKKDLDVLVSDKEKGPGTGVDANFINQITSKSLDTKNKDIILDLYFEIQRYLTGDKKSTMSNRDKLYESIDIISDKVKKVIIAEKIARFTTRAMQFDGENLYGGLGDIGKPLQEFVDSMKQILQIDLKEKSPVKGQEIKDKEKSKDESNESVLSSYGNFVKIILEKSLDVDELKKKFDELFTEEVQKSLCPYDEEQIESLKKTGELPGGRYLITDVDPIISIIRIFRRAYRLHTPGMIPSGRSGGKVSISVFNEYEYMGSGTGGDASSPGGGPYRNIKLFDQWMAGVESIKSDSKYRPLFSDNTVFEFESETGKGDKIRRGGKMLLRFINKLQDDNEMYGGGGSEKGALNKFYEEYFGLKLDQDKVEPTSWEKQQTGTISETAESISTTECEWSNLSDVGISDKNLYRFFLKPDRSKFEKLAFRFKIKNKEGKDVSYFACVDYFFESKKCAAIIFSRDGWPFDLTKLKMSPKPLTPKKVYYGVIESDFQEGTECKLRYLDIEKSANISTTPETLNGQISEIKVLKEKGEKEPYLDTNTRLRFQFEKFNDNKQKARMILK